MVQNTSQEVTTYETHSDGNTNSAVAVTFTAPAFAGEKKEEKKSSHVVMYGDEKKDKGGKANETFAEKKEEKKGQ